MKIKELTTLEELFTDLISNNHLESYGLNYQQVIQLQGQIEEGLGLLNDAIDEIQTIDPESVAALKALITQTLK